MKYQKALGDPATKSGKEDLEVLKNIYFIDMKDIKEIFLTSPYSDDKIFLEILKEYKCK